MVNESKINAIASAEEAGLYYSNNTESGYNRQTKGERNQGVFTQLYAITKAL